MKFAAALPSDPVEVPLHEVEPADAPVPMASRPRLALIIVGTSVALLIQSVGYAVGRAGHEGLALTLFFVGLVAMFAMSAWRLLGNHVIRKERIAVSVILVVGLTLSVFLVSPLLFDGYDDLLHQASLWQWGAHRGVLAHNTLLPVSPRYPGLEALTLGIRWLTGLPLVVCEMGTILMSRIILVLAIFFVVERLTRSSRAAGAGVVVYAASPQFYSFNAAFAYQTLALALGAGCVYLVLRVIDQRQQSARDAWLGRRWLWLSIACCLATVVTHHLVGWLTVLLLVAWFLALACLRRSSEARIVGTVAGVGLLGAVAWTSINDQVLWRYLKPILSEPFSALSGLVEGHRRSLFQGAGTFTTPLWEEAVMVVAALIVVALMVVAVRAVASEKTTMRGGRLRGLPMVIALGYVLVLGSRLEAGSAEVGGRLSTFVFFGIAVVVGAWYAVAGRRLWKPAVLGIAAVCFLGGMLFGSNPDWLDVPGPYVAPSADQRSIDAASIAAARWAAANLPANSIVAADRDNGALMAAIGHLDPESEASGGVNVGPLYFAHAWGPADTALVRRTHIRYLVVDQRLATGPPVFGAYFEPGETTGRDRLTRSELAKFSYVWGMQRIYDNGPIQIYDLAGLLRLSPEQARAGAPQAWPYGPNWALFAAAAVFAIWVRALRSRSAEDLLTALLGATLTLMACAVVIFFVPLPSIWLGVGILCVFAVLGLMANDPPALHHRRGEVVETGNGHHHRPRRRRWGTGRYVMVAALTAAVLGSAVTIATVSEATAWRPPVSLAVHNGNSGTAVVDVHLPDRSAPAQLVLWADGAVVSDWHIPPGVTSWSVGLPARADRPATSRALLEFIVLRENGRVVREVTV